jgi:hypothetical protein
MIFSGVGGGFTYSNLRRTGGKPRGDPDLVRGLGFNAVCVFAIYWTARICGGYTSINSGRYTCINNTCINNSGGGPRLKGVGFNAL